MDLHYVQKIDTRPRRSSDASRAVRADTGGSLCTTYDSIHIINNNEFDVMDVGMEDKVMRKTSLHNDPHRMSLNSTLDTSSRLNDTANGKMLNKSQPKQKALSLIDANTKHELNNSKRFNQASTATGAHHDMSIESKFDSSEIFQASNHAKPHSIASTSTAVTVDESVDCKNCFNNKNGSLELLDYCLRLENEKKQLVDVVLALKGRLLDMDTRLVQFENLYNLQKNAEEFEDSINEMNNVTSSETKSNASTYARLQDSDRKYSSGSVLEAESRVDRYGNSRLIKSRRVSIKMVKCELVDGSYYRYWFNVYVANDKVCTLSKRYREFRALHCSLRNLYSKKKGWGFCQMNESDDELEANDGVQTPPIGIAQNTASKFHLPDFPSKRYFGNLNDDFVQSREMQLENYVNILGDLFTRVGYRSEGANLLLHFLQVQQTDVAPSHVSDLNSPDVETPIIVNQVWEEYKNSPAVPLNLAQRDSAAQSSVNEKFNESDYI